MLPCAICSAQQLQSHGFVRFMSKYINRIRNGISCACKTINVRQPREVGNCGGGGRLCTRTHTLSLSGPFKTARNIWPTLLPCQMPKLHKLPFYCSAASLIRIDPTKWGSSLPFMLASTRSVSLNNFVLLKQCPHRMPTPLTVERGRKEWIRAWLCVRCVDSICHRSWQESNQLDWIRRDIIHSQAQRISRPNGIGTVRWTSPYVCISMLRIKSQTHANNAGNKPRIRYMRPDCPFLSLLTPRWMPRAWRCWAQPKRENSEPKTAKFSWFIFCIAVTVSIIPAVCIQCRCEIHGNCIKLSTF